MKLGMICCGTEREKLERVKSFGLDFAEFCVNFTDGDPDAASKFASKAAETARLMKEVGLPCGSVGYWAGKKLNDDGSVYEQGLADDRALLLAAAELGSPVYVTGCNYSENLSLYENCSAAIGYFEQLIAMGKEHGIRIATYNCRWNNFVHSDPAWSIIQGHLKDLYIKYDPSHSRYAMKEDYLSETKKWGGQFGHVHVKGSLIVDGERLDDPPAGMDQTNWGAFMAALYAVGYDGGLSIEPHSSVWQGEIGEQGIRYTVKMIREMMFR